MSAFRLDSGASCAYSFAVRAMLPLTSPSEHGHDDIARGSLEVDAVRDRNDFRAVAFELLEDHQHVADAAASESVEPEHVELADVALP